MFIRQHCIACQTSRYDCGENAEYAAAAATVVRQQGWLRRDGNETGLPNVCPNCVKTVVYGGKPLVVGDTAFDDNRRFESGQGWCAPTTYHATWHHESVRGPHLADIIQLALMSLQPLRVGDVLMGTEEVIRFIDSRNVLQIRMETNGGDGRNVVRYFVTSLHAPDTTGHVADILADALRALTVGGEHAPRRRIVDDRERQPVVKREPTADGRREFWSPILVTRIRVGVQPHEGEPCACVLCALPRGDAWGDDELERRIQWMADEAHRSLRALAAFTLGGRTEGDGR